MSACVVYDSAWRPVAIIGCALQGSIWRLWEVAGRGSHCKAMMDGVLRLALALLAAKPLFSGSWWRGCDCNRYMLEHHCV